MKRIKFLPIALLIMLFSGLALADYDSEIRNLKQEKEKLNSEIQNLTRQIAVTDSCSRQTMPATRRCRAATVQIQNVDVLKSTA